ncbi:uncharacterized protein METZ01_LOCUS502560, partial [marine metagenome]
RNPRSTVGTVTEIYDYLRLLFSRVGEPHCISCSRLVHRHTIQQMVDRILQEPQGSKLLILAPIPDVLASDDGVFSDALRAGFERARVNGEVIALDSLPVIDGTSATQIEIVVDRIVIGPDQASRIADSLETALRMGTGTVLIQNLAGLEFFLSDHFYCGHCKAGFPDLEPRAFSFNSPHGACGTCDGLGSTFDFDPALVVPDSGVSIAEGALAPIDGLSSNGGTLSRLMHALS